MPKFKEWRIYIFFIIMVICGGAIMARLFTLQILKYDFYNALAQDQYLYFQEIFPQRSEVYIVDSKDNKLIPLAVNKEFKQVYAIPKLLDPSKKDSIVVSLSNILELDSEMVNSRLSKENDPYEPLKYKVDDQVAEKIEQLECPAIKTYPQIERYYPADSLASHIIGFVGNIAEQKIGQYGLEGFYEDELKGKMGTLVGEKDTAGRWIPTTEGTIEPAEDGPQIILTVDQNVQYNIETELKAAIEKYQAQSGTIIVLDVQSGAVMAMASYPNFDPNKYFEVDNLDAFLNPAIQKVYEPGSVFKAFTMAAGLDSGKLKPEDTFTDTGPVMLAGRTIRNVNNKIYGQQTMSQILENSINTGSVYIQQKTTQDIFLDYVQKFGFGSLTGIDLAGEVKGNISNLYEKRDIDYATASFGQGISVTPLQLVSAMAAIANQGKLMQPYVVAKKIYSDGYVEMTQPKMIRQVINPQTAKDLTKMLAAVIDQGQSSLAQVTGYSVAGKTGTAEVPKEGEPGYSDQTNHTFCGFAPAYNARFAILIKLEKPVSVRWAATSVTPIFREIAKYLFNYFEIPPS